MNILVHGIHPEQSADAAATSEWLEDAINGPEVVGVSEFVLSSMVRVATRPGVFRTPSTPGECMEFAEALLAAPAVQVVRPGPRHWAIFRELVTTYRLRGNDVPDAYQAALAMEHGATFVTLDRGFARFEGLRTLNPLAT